MYIYMGYIYIYVYMYLAGCRTVKLREVSPSIAEAIDTNPKQKLKVCMAVVMPCRHTMRQRCRDMETWRRKHKRPGLLGRCVHVKFSSI